MSSDLPRRGTSVPSEPPELLPGQSANSWLRISTFSLIGAVAGMALWEVDLSVLPAGTFRDDLAYAIGCTILVLGVVSVVAYFLSWRAARREQRAGYTTTYFKVDADLWLLDRRTGEVLSRPGEPRTRRRGDRAKRGS